MTLVLQTRVQTAILTRSVKLRFITISRALSDTLGQNNTSQYNKYLDEGIKHHVYILSTSKKNVENTFWWLG